MTNKETIGYFRTHSYFGFLESLLSPQDLVRAAEENHIQVLGLTDHHFLSGSIAFYEACIMVNIKPVLGLEIDIDYRGYQGRLTFLAQNKRGWSNLCSLSTLGLASEVQISIEILEKFSKGLICFAGGAFGILRALIFNSPAPQGLPKALLGDLKNIFNQHLFIEIQRFHNGPLKNEGEITQLAKKHQLPIIATQSIYYKDFADQEKYRTLSAIRHNTTLQDLKSHQLPPASAHFPSRDEFIYRFRDCPEAIKNHPLLLERFTFDLPIGQLHYPKFPTPPNVSQSEFLREKAYQGAQRHYQKLTKEITDRLDYELDIISGMGYEPIFLIVEDVLNHARRLGIPTSSRGSAASSLVAHCLNITSPDPLALNLYFERFLNPARKKPPDIDTDISSKDREKVIQYVFDKFGEDRTAMVGTINRYRPKSAFGDVAKAYGLSPETIRQLSKKLPSSFRFRSDDETNKPFAPIKREGSIPVINKIIDDAAAILDLPRHLSVHPAGIIISPFPITELIPLVHSSSLGINHAQFDLDDIEKLGMVKIDLLGIRGLTVLGEVADRIQSWHISEYKNGLEVLATIPKEDFQTALTVSEAKTIGCFQIESPGMRATLREISAKTPEDIMAALALYRPGPLKGGLRDAFVRRFRGDELVVHIHESLDDLLDETFGVILYQEQVLRIAHELGGLSIAQADILRRAMSHFDPGGVMDTLRKNFIEGAAIRKGVPSETAERIWEMMAAFAGYGFPKAHAASYAQLAWNAAWCKTHYPAEFMSAVLGFGGGYYSQRVYLMEAHRLGLKINPPHINHSNHRFRVKYPQGEPVLYMGLDQVRDLTQNTIQIILSQRPYQSLEDFLMRANPQKKEAENLIKCGALEGLTYIPEGLRRISHQSVPGQMTLFTSSNQLDNWTLDQRIAAQQEILGVNLTISPFERYSDQIQASGALSTLEAQNRIGEKILVAGMRQTMRRFRTRSGQMMAYLNLEDFDGSLQVVIPPKLYSKRYQVLLTTGPFLVEGVMEKDSERGNVRISASDITSLI